MLRILIAILMLTFSTNAFAVTQWNKAKPATGDSLTSWPTDNQANLSILDTLLSNYRRSMTIIYKNSTTLTVSAGEVVVSNSGGSLRLFLQNAANADITTANLDTGSSFNASTTYYVYAGTSSSTAASATYYISLSSSAPTGITYYANLGSFTTDGSSNILSYKIASTANGIVWADASGNLPLSAAFNYGTSTSSSTLVTGGLKIAYGNTGSISFGTCSSITNLPFTSSSSYYAIASAASGNSSQNACSISSQASNSMSVCAVSVPAGININVSCNWFALGN
jgi:hypothetical protein